MRKNQFPFYWSEAEHKTWEVRRAKGAFNHIVIRGVLLWGVPMLFFISLLTFFARHRPVTGAFILVSTVVWLFGGSLFGVSTWVWNERCFRKFDYCNG